MNMDDFEDEASDYYSRVDLMNRLMRENRASQRDEGCDVNYNEPCPKCGRPVFFPDESEYEAITMECLCGQMVTSTLD